MPRLTRPNKLSFRLAVEVCEDRITPTLGLDTTFASGGRAVADFGAGVALPTSTAVQNDGRILVAGTVQVSGTDPGRQDSDLDFAVARLNPDGTRDTSFGTNGRVTVDVGQFGMLPLSWSRWYESPIGR